MSLISYTGPASGAAGIYSPQFTILFNSALPYDPENPYVTLNIESSDGGLLTVNHPEPDEGGASSHFTFTGISIGDLIDGNLVFDYHPDSPGDKTITITNDQGWNTLVISYVATGAPGEGDDDTPSEEQHGHGGRAEHVQLDYRTARQQVVTVDGSLARVTIMRRNGETITYATTAGGHKVQYKTPLTVNVPSALFLFSNGRPVCDVTFVRRVRTG